jgi:hypothetical protein
MLVFASFTSLKDGVTVGHYLEEANRRLLKGRRANCLEVKAETKV